MFTFQELGGSPHEKYTVDGFSATRRFLVPWEQRTEFAQAVFGTTERLTYPGRSDVFAYTLDFEPLEPDMIGVRTLENLKTDLVDYNGSFAQAVVKYAVSTGSERSDVPLNDEKTSITYKMVVDSEEVTLPAGGWKWADTYGAIPAGTQVVKKLPITEHVLTWSEVVDPPWEVITSLQGKVNANPFLGCSAGTLLFRGAEANKLYRRGAGVDEEPASFVWAIKYTFRERAIKMNGVVYGWNYLYRETTSTWVNVINTMQANLYDKGDFSTLFHTVQPVIGG